LLPQLQSSQTPVVLQRYYHCCYNPSHHLTTTSRDKADVLGRMPTYMQEGWLKTKL
jgi:hypothetical protein